MTTFQRSVVLIGGGDDRRWKERRWILWAAHSNNDSSSSSSWVCNACSSNRGTLPSPHCTLWVSLAGTRFGSRDDVGECLVSGAAGGRQQEGSGVADSWQWIQWQAQDGAVRSVWPGSS